MQHWIRDLTLWSQHAIFIYGCWGHNTSRIQILHQRKFKTRFFYAFCFAFLLFCCFAIYLFFGLFGCFAGEPQHARQLHLVGVHRGRARVPCCVADRGRTPHVYGKRHHIIKSCSVRVHVFCSSGSGNHKFNHKFNRKFLHPRPVLSQWRKLYKSKMAQRLDSSCVLISDPGTTRLHTPKAVAYHEHLDLE